MIKLKNITKKFQNFTAVKNLDLKIDDGMITMLIGPSGCGKTSTLKMINRLIDATEGDILINNKSIYSYNPIELRRSIGYVIQEVGLFPHMNIYENIAVVPRLLKWNEKDIKSRVEELLDLVTLNTTFMYKYPLQLSGGERQRVGLARALAADPKILLMDEPFGAIDPINRAKLHDSFIEIQDKIKKTIVFVTHDINEAIKLGDKIAVLNKGSLVQYDSVQNILYDPKNDFVEKILGHDRNIKALVLKKSRDYIIKNDYEIFTPEENDKKIIDVLKSRKKYLAIITDQDNSYIETKVMIINDKKNECRLESMEEGTEVKRNNNLQETFSKMIETGERRLPVVDKDDKFVGIINLFDILNEFKKG